jgi:hypothetical protein
MTCMVEMLAREHARLNDICLGEEEDSFLFNQASEEMHMCRRLAANHVPQTAEGWAFQAETLEIGHTEVYGRLHRMLLDHFQALARTTGRAGRRVAGRPDRGTA